MPEPSIYDLLTNTKVSDLTVANLDAAAKNTFIDRDNVKYWSGIITVARAMEESRTFAKGLPIPEGGKVAITTVDDAATGELRPSGTEVWLIQSIVEDNCTVFLTDGVNVVNISSDQGYIARTRNPIYLTNTLYLGFQNGSGSEQTPGVAYHKVSL